MRQHLTLLGDRQAGKTTALIRLAALEAVQGESVLYHCQTAPMADDCFHRAVEWLQESALSKEVLKVAHTTGHQRILFVSGGRIVFLPQESRTMRSITPDIHVMDDVQTEPHVAARRIYRGVLR